MLPRSPAGGTNATSWRRPACGGSSVAYAWRSFLASLSGRHRGFRRGPLLRRARTFICTFGWGATAADDGCTGPVDGRQVAAEVGADDLRIARDLLRGALGDHRAQL